MIARKMIMELERIGLAQMEGAPGSKADKLRVIRNEIGRNCEVGSKTVENWRAGAVPGKAGLRLLRQYFEKELKCTK